MRWGPILYPSVVLSLGSWSLLPHSPSPLPPCQLAVNIRHSTKPYHMPQTLLLSTTDRNCRPIVAQFSAAGGKRVHHTQYTYTVHSFSWSLLSFVAESSASGPQSGIAPYHSLPLSHLYIYISLVVEEALHSASSFLSLLMEWIDHVDKLTLMMPFSLSSTLEVHWTSLQRSVVTHEGTLLQHLRHVPFVFSAIFYLFNVLFNVLQVDGRGIHILRFLHTFAPSIHPALGDLWSKRLNNYLKGTVACDFN